MKRYLKFFALGLLLAGTFAACNKHEVKSEHGACCHKEGSEAKAMALSTNPENSIYQLNGKWTNAQNQQMELSQLKGKIQLVAMVFTHCGYACPRMVDNIKNIEQQLPEAIRKKVGVVLVSFDVERDTAERLKQYASEKQLDHSWTLLHGNEEEVRTLSMLLHVQYDKLNDGSFNHSNILTVLDEKGNIAKQLEGLDIDSKNVAEAIEHLAKK